MTQNHIRTACIETDVPGIAQICNACEPSNPVTVDRVRGWLQNNEPGRIQLRLVAVGEENGALAGYSVIVHEANAPAHHFFVWLGVDPGMRCQGIGSALWAASLNFLKEQGATRLGSEVLDNDPTGLAFAERCGFTIDRHNFHSTLDLTIFDETPYQLDIAALQAQGIRFCSLADFPDNPDILCKFYDLNLATVMDIPGEDWDYAAYPQFFEEHILGASWFHRENQLLAVDGDRFVGMAMISLTPETQRAYNATTGVIRAYRGRKIAQALKALAACYARQHGAREIGTDNDSLNAPMLAVNRKLGYQPQSGKYLLVSWLGPIDKPVLQVGRGVPRC